MNKDAFFNALGQGGRELMILIRQPDLLISFVALMEHIDRLPHVERRFRKQRASIYQAISKQTPVEELARLMVPFFGQPIDGAAQTAASCLCAAHLGGIKADQTWFVKKIGAGEFYGALWPWQQNKDVVTIHLGLVNPQMPAADYQNLAKQITAQLAQQVSREVEKGVGGQIHGISLPSFLQMSEMEGTTCTLKIRSRNNIGMLHLADGRLIDAETKDLKHKEAAYVIIGWDDASIDILAPKGKKEDNIRAPLMSVLMDSLKVKDEKAYDQAAAQKPAAKKTAPSAKPSTAQKPAAAPAEATTTSATTAETAKAPAAPADEPRGKPPAKTTDRAAPATATTPTGGIAAPAAETEIDRRLLDGRASKPSETRPAAPPAPAKMRKWLWPAVAGAGLAAAAAVLFWWYGAAPPSEAERFERILQQVAQQSSPGRQEQMLLNFLSAVQSDDIRRRVQDEIAAARRRIEKADYEKVVDQVYQLPMDDQYTAAARRLYHGFLAAYPQSAFRADIAKALNDIARLTDDIAFAELNQIAAEDYLQRVKACDDYLANYPAGQHRQKVQSLKQQALALAYQNFERRLRTCERQRKWSECAALCAAYMAEFSGYVEMAGIQQRQDTFKARAAWRELNDTLAGADDSTAHRLYADFLKAFPNAEHSAEARKALAALDQQAAAAAKWQRLEPRTADASVDLQARIRMLQNYLQTYAHGPFADAARDRLAQLKVQLPAAATPETAPPKTAPAAAAASGVTEKERQRRNAVRQKMHQALSANPRFEARADDTVRDTLTGQIWSLLDSQADLGRCLDYKGAGDYVKHLDLGGHTDWRLPTSSELAAIYKNKPFFPSDGGTWYWTSESYAKGYDEVANTVSSVPETEYNKISRRHSECGAVRAVRP